MPGPVQIRGPKLLLVEGRDTEAFFIRLRDSLGLRNDIQVVDFGGVSQLRARLRGLPDVSGFATISALGTIRDAELDASAAFQSVCAALQSAGLATPTVIGQISGQRPRVGVFILPDGTAIGSLETLLMRTVGTDPAISCIDAFFACLRNETGVHRANQDKARVHAFLASRANPALRSGEAFDAGYWPRDSPALDPVKEFFRRL